MPLFPRAAALSALVTAGLLCVPGTLLSRAPSPRELSERASRYVQQLDRTLVALVGEEQYEQRSFEARGGRPPTEQRRRLQSRVAWVRLARVDDTVAVREVLASPSSRLHDLLSAPAGELEANVRALLDESAAQNLVPGSRNINFPTFSLVYLRDAHLERSRWKTDGREGILTVLSFRERQRPSIVRSDAGHHLSAQGRFWIEELTGRVERAEVQLAGREWVGNGDEARPRNVEVRIRYRQEVGYAPDERLGVWLPSRMIDRYERTASGSVLEVTGEATYSNYRRFETRGRVVTGAR